MPPQRPRQSREKENDDPSVRVAADEKTAAGAFPTTVAVSSDTKKESADLCTGKRSARGVKADGR